MKGASNMARINATNPPSDATSRIQNPTSSVPRVAAATTASTSSAAVSAIMVPPTAAVTASFLLIPMLLASGYASSVCEARSAPSRTALGVLNPSRTPAPQPSTSDSPNVRAPNRTLCQRYRRNPCRSISSPARNIR